MEKISGISEAIMYLKDGSLITDGSGYYIFKNEKIHHYYDGNHYSLSIEDFMQLYKKNSFYLYEETVEIDESKDEAYYRYYRK